MSGEARLPKHYALADRSPRECAVLGCRAHSALGITVCPVHEYAWDRMSNDERDALGWEAFLREGAPDE